MIDVLFPSHKLIYTKPFNDFSLIYYEFLPLCKFFSNIELSARREMETESARIRHDLNSIHGNIGREEIGEHLIRA